MYLNIFQNLKNFERKSDKDEEYDMNQTMLMGHLGGDPEVRFTSSGKKVTTLRMAVNRKRGGKEETLWWRITLWGEQFDELLKYCKKGSAIVAIGEMLKPEIFTNKEGQPQVSLNLVAYHLSFSPFGRGERVENAQQGSSFHEPAQNSYAPNGEFLNGAQQGKGESTYDYSNTFAEDEIPF